MFWPFKKRKKKIISTPPENRVTSIIFITFDQGGWCECGHCGASVFDGSEDHCSECGYKFDHSSPTGNVGASWGGSDF